MARPTIPTPAQWDSFAEIADQLAEVDWTDLTWEEALSLLRALCNHPVTGFACAFCAFVKREDKK